MSPFCSQHGPYEGDSCPYCSGVPFRPQQPDPLNEEDMVTDPGTANRKKPRSDDETDPTEIGSRRIGYDDKEDIEETDYAKKYGRDIDETEFDSYQVTGTEGLFWVIEGRRRGKHYDVKDGTEIGRKVDSRPGNILLNEANISEHHAKIRLENDQLTIWDLASKNGVFVNGERIRAATSIQENDVIKIGDNVFVLKTLSKDLLEKIKK